MAGVDRLRRLIHSKAAAGLSRSSADKEIRRTQLAAQGVDMMNETTKALLMIAMFWSLMVAIRIPEMRLSERWAVFQADLRIGLLSDGVDGLHVTAGHAEAASAQAPIPALNKFQSAP